MTEGTARRFDIRRVLVACAGALAGVGAWQTMASTGNDDFGTGMTLILSAGIAGGLISATRGWSLPIDASESPFDHESTTSRMSSSALGAPLLRDIGVGMGAALVAALVGGILAVLVAEEGRAEDLFYMPIVVALAWAAGFLAAWVGGILFVLPAAMIANHVRRRRQGRPSHTGWLLTAGLVAAIVPTAVLLALAVDPPGSRFNLLHGIILLFGDDDAYLRHEWAVWPARVMVLVTAAALAGAAVWGRRERTRRNAERTRRIAERESR